MSDRFLILSKLWNNSFMFSKKLINQIIYLIARIAKFLPFYEKAVIKNCKIHQTNWSKTKKSLFGRVINILFMREYYYRSLPDRVQILSKLMGRDAGAIWASQYDETRENYPPKRGEKIFDHLDWFQICQGFDKAISLLQKDPKNYCFIQLGGSSGKEISYFAQKFLETDFIYTDIFHETTSYARSQLTLPNLKYVTCPAESLACVAEASRMKKILIFTHGSAQYVFPENLDYSFKLLSNIRDKQIDIIFDEPGTYSDVDPLKLIGSHPRGNFSYTHNYRYYAEKNGFETIDWNLVKLEKSSINLNGWFHYENN